MIYPILSYGNPVLKQEAEEIEADYEGLQTLIDDMFETMYASEGVGLAAPQIGKSIRLFVIDPANIDENLTDLKRVFINPEVIRLEGDEWDYEEGCLSLPDIREKICRPDQVLINYLDRNFEEQEEFFSGIAGRIVQHEYDHIEGVLFTDHLSPLKRRMLKKRLDAIKRGEVDVNYAMRFPGSKKRVS
jgi:peptide deformylase